MATDVKTSQAQPTLFSARRKLQSALSTVENPEVSLLQVRRAQVMVVGAVDVLERYALRRAESDAEEQRRHARALAKTMRDARGRRRTAVTMPGYRRGQAPVSKGVTYQKTPPTINETLRMLALVPALRKVEIAECPSCHQAWRQPHLQECINPYAERMKALIYILWRCGLRIGCEALRLTENDLYPADGYLYVAHGKNDKHRQVFVDEWVWPLLAPWLTLRQAYPPGPLFCVIEGPTAGVRPWCGPSIRLNLRALAKLAGVRHRVAPHQWRHAMTVEQYEEGQDLLVISRNLGHSSLEVTNTYLEGFPQSRVIAELRARPVPKVTMFDMLRSSGVNVGDRPEHRRGLNDILVPTVRAGDGHALTPDLMGVLSRRPAEEEVAA